MKSRPASRDPAAALARPPAADRSPRPLETATVLHVGALLLLGSWAFGGGADWARRLIAAWGSLGALLTLAAIRSRAGRPAELWPTLRWLCPLAAFNALVLLSCLNPSFSERIFAGQALLAQTGAAHPQLPSTVHPPTSREHLWLFDAIYLSCFNLALTVRRRQALRALLLVAVGNAVLLSVFGTFQKLTSDGLFFGAVAAPNPRFFATFVYANHWAAYLILWLGACLGLLFYYARRIQEGQFSASALSLGIMGLLVMSITPLLAGSRAGTLLAISLLGAGLCHALRNLWRQRRARGKSIVLPAAGLVLCGLIAAGSAGYLGRAAIQERWQDTQGQWQNGLVHERLGLYADTWHLAAEHPAFGWGFGSFAQVFQLLRPRPVAADRQYEHSYVDAHSDWLQSLAEVGFIGTALLILTAAWPLLSSQALRYVSALPAYLLGGCGLILLYSGVEFPFANPAVMIAFWLCFFCAIHYVRLNVRTRAGH